MAHKIRAVLRSNYMECVDVKPATDGTSDQPSTMNQTSTIPGLITVIIPTYNRSELLARSVSSVLAQTHIPLELIVVDDGSTENIREAVQAIAPGKTTVVRREDRGGAAAARNTGCEVARGEFIAFLDSDDEWLPEKLEAQISMLRAHPEIALCCTAFVLVRRDGQEEIRQFDTDEIGTTDLAFGCELSPGSSLVFRKEFFSVVGTFHTAMPRFEDWDWLVRGSALSRIGLINRPLCKVYAGPRPTEEMVLASTLQMKAFHGSTFRREGIRHYLKFRAGLLHEESIAAYGAGKYGLAIGKLILSLIVFPVRKRNFIARSVRALSSSRTASSDSR